jgi:hypothetical protein
MWPPAPTFEQLPQNKLAITIEANKMENLLADINADGNETYNAILRCSCHGTVLLLLAGNI